MKLYRAEMGGIAPWLWTNSGNLNDASRAWTQQPDHWTLFFLEHAGGFCVNNRSYPFNDGFVALVAPGTKAGFLRVGEDTAYHSFTFNLVKRIETVALPALVDLGEKTEFRRRELRETELWLTRSIGRGLAFVYNLLWDVALPSDRLRASSVVYDFETLVVGRLREKLTVSGLAAELGVSQSQLLRLVRAEHGGTVQDFIREKRAEIARTLIVSTDEPLKAIAMRIGMPDLQYFNKAIRNASGLSPRALRESRLRIRWFSFGLSPRNVR